MTLLELSSEEGLNITGVDLDICQWNGRIALCPTRSLMYTLIKNHLTPFGPRGAVLSRVWIHSGCKAFGSGLRRFDSGQSIRRSCRRL
jgi:hypothetical protein